MDKEKDSRALELGKACYEGIEEMFNRLDSAKDEKLIDEINQEIDESDYGVNITKVYEITLAGGGPAVRISGELDEHNEPYTARIEYQDWFTQWTEYRPASEELLLRFAQRHYFGN